MGVPEDLSGIDFDAALARVGGDKELLREIAVLFLEQCPASLANIRQAVAAGDPEALQETAHYLKGSVANFGAKTAFDAAYALERMGRQRDLSESPAALADLENALEEMRPRLIRLIGEGNTV